MKRLQIKAKVSDALIDYKALKKFINYSQLN